MSDTSSGWSSRHSQDFRGISSHKRSCTDLYCLTVLLIFICGWLAVGYYAYWNGDVIRLTAPKDSHGRTCGVDEDVKSSKYLLFYDITQCVSFSVFLFGCPTKQICVPKCPRESWSSDYYIKNPPRNWRQVQEQLICEDPAAAKSVNSVEALKNAVQSEKCAPYYVKSTSAFFHTCLPNPFGENDISIQVDVMENNTTETAQTLNYFNYGYRVSKALEKDFKKCWHFVLLFIVTAMVTCLFTILIMGVITKIFVWMVLWLILVLLLCCTVISFFRYNSIPAVETSFEETENVAKTRNFYSETFYGQLTWLFEQKQTWLVLFISSGVFFFLFGLLIVFLRSRISLAILLIGEGSKAINTIKSTLCLPVITRLLQLAVLIWFILIFLYVKSLGNSVYKVEGLLQDKDCFCTYKDNDWCLPHQFNTQCTSISLKGPCVSAKCAFTEFRSPKLKFYFQLYNFFGLLWGLYFVSGFIRLILALCFKTWYWTYNKHDVPFFTLLYSIIIAIRYHLGTIAVGSFLIATCGFIRAILQRVQRMVKNTDGLLMQCSMWSLKCCFWMLQKFLIFISNNAYIMCSIMGYGFFQSAQEAFSLLTRNAIRVVVLDKVLDFLMLIGKLAVTIVMVFISYFTFSANSLQLNYPWAPTIFVGILTWIISSSFFGVYSVAVDTLFLSFLRDGELNDGSQNKPYYMSRKMKYILKENARS